MAQRERDMRQRALPKGVKGEDRFGNHVLKGEKKPKALRTGSGPSVFSNEKLLTEDEKAKAASKDAVSKIASEEARRKFTRIDSFEGIFDFLSMDSVCDVSWDGRVYKTAKHALLAAQYPEAVLDLEEADSVEAAVKAIKGTPEADDWSSRRLKAMENILRDKFRRSADFRKRLQETGDREIKWENDEDQFWGCVKGKGQNQLGRGLTEIRQSIIDDTEFAQWLFLCCEMESEKIKQPPVELLEKKETDDGVQSKVHRLDDSGYFKLGKVPPPANAVQALHPSVSREHAMIVHTKSHLARRTGGVALVDLGSKAGTSVSGRQLKAFVMEPLKNNDSIKLGASTRVYMFKVNLQSQIALLEQQERELIREVSSIDADAANPVEAAKRAAREEQTIFVGNLDFETEKADLLGLFQDCGHIEEVRFPGQDGSKASKGIAFVLLDSAMAARRACGLNFEEFKGRKIKIAPATENRAAGKGGDGEGKGKDKGEKGKGKGKRKDKDKDKDKGQDPQIRTYQDLRFEPDASSKGGQDEMDFGSAKGSALARDRDRDRDRDGERSRRDDGHRDRGSSPRRSRSRRSRRRRSRSQSSEPRQRQRKEEVREKTKKRVQHSDSDSDEQAKSKAKRKR